MIRLQTEEKIFIFLLVLLVIAIFHAALTFHEDKQAAPARLQPAFHPHPTLPADGVLPHMDADLEIPGAYAAAHDKKAEATQ